MKLISLLFFLLLSQVSLSQEFSDMWGMYKSSQDFVSKKSFYVADFSSDNTELDDVYNNKQEVIYYRIKSSDSKANSLVKKEIVWGIYKDSILFLNAKRMGMRNGYLKVREFGKYSHFMGEYVLSIAEQDQIMRRSVAFGAIGGGLMAGLLMSDGVNSKGILPYLMNLEVGVPHILDKVYLEFILRDYPDLAEQFKSEAKPDDLETQLKYVRLLNKRQDR
ncbi:MAG: DUF6563 family protein [Bacteroidia bacterium]